jgi:hypothetical protein
VSLVEPSHARCEAGSGKEVEGELVVAGAMALYCLNVAKKFSIMVSDVREDASRRQPEIDRPLLCREPAQRYMLGSDTAQSRSLSFTTR